MGAAEKQHNRLDTTESIKIVDWMRSNVEAFKGLTFAEVGQLIQQEGIAGQKKVSPDTVSRLSKSGGIDWERPNPPKMPSCEEMKDIYERIGKIEASRLKFLEIEKINSEILEALNDRIREVEQRANTLFQYIESLRQQVADMRKVNRFREKAGK